MANILVITDDAPSRHLLDALLSLHGYHVMFAESGRKGIELFRTTCPDVVVLDLRIPDMKVLSILRQVRNLHAHQPVIILAGDGTADSEQEGRTLGVNEVIGKGMLPCRILGALRRLFKAPAHSSVCDLQLAHGEWRTIS